MEPFTIVYDALQRPRRFLAFLNGGWRAIGWGTASVMLWVGTALAFVGLILPQMIPLNMRSLLTSLLIVPLFVLAVSGLCIITNTSTASIPASIAFWLLRCQIAITPVLAILVAVMSSPALPVPIEVLGFGLPLLIGAWCGGGVTVTLELRPRRVEAIGARWVLALGAMMIGIMVWFSPPLRGTTWFFAGPFCAGLAIGLLRCLSYSWQAPWSLALALAQRLSVSVFALLPLHPASFDDLCVLPLPGLRRLLLHACAVDLDRGGTWLLRIAHHPGQQRAAYRAIRAAASDVDLAHPLLFWLSTDDEGIELLHDMIQASDHPHPLITAYTAFAHVAAPQIWIEALERHRSAIAAAESLSGGHAVAALLNSGVGVLQADRWVDAIRALNAVPPATGVEDDVFWTALDILRAWTTTHTPVMISNRKATLRALLVELEDLKGWPAALLAAIGEHMLFLIQVEQRRGAWLA